MPDPLEELAIDSQKTDPELFLELYCKNPGIEELGDLWLDVP